jgi:hypothetical protein
LSPADRRYLNFSHEERLDEYTRPARRKREDAIEERLNHGVIDLDFLTRTIDQAQIDLDDVFTTGKSPGVDFPRIQMSIPGALRLLIRGILADERNRQIKGYGFGYDFSDELRPVTNQFETSIEQWLIAQQQIIGDVELEVSVDNRRTVESLIEELEARQTAVGGEERDKKNEILECAGIGEEKRQDLLGEDPSNDGVEPAESSYSTEELAALPIEGLGELLQRGVITLDAHTAALEKKLENNDS